LFIQLISLVFIEKLVIYCLELGLGCIVTRNWNANNNSNLKVLKFLEVSVIEEEELELIDSKGTLEVDIVMQYVVQLVQLGDLLVAEHAESGVAHVEYDVISMELVHLAECQLTIENIIEVRLDLLHKTIRLFIFRIF
jgi:hypothetical protein